MRSTKYACGRILTKTLILRSAAIAADCACMTAPAAKTTMIIFRKKPIAVSSFPDPEARACKQVRRMV
jgi:hypothetical protein